MLNKLKNLFSGKDAAEDSSAKKSPSGYFTPSTGAELLALPHRKKLLKQLWDNTSLPENVYERLYLEPLRTLAQATQNVPATSAGEWSSEGGYLDLTIKFTAYSVRLAKGYMFPPGAAPEEQAAQNSLWNAVIFWAALFHHLPLLAHYEGELLDGSFWPPGVKAPDSIFRFRNIAKDAGNVSGQPLATFIAARLLPQDGILWLSSKPAALGAMTHLMHQGKSGIPLIEEILAKARELVCSPDLRAPGILDNTLTTAESHPSTKETSPIPGLEDTLSLTASGASLEPAIDVSIAKSHQLGSTSSGDALSANPELAKNMDALLSSALPHSETDLNLVPEKLQQSIENTEPEQKVWEDAAQVPEDDTTLLLSMFAVDNDNDDKGLDTDRHAEMPINAPDFSENSQESKLEPVPLLKEACLAIDPTVKSNNLDLEDTVAQDGELEICVKEKLNNENLKSVIEEPKNNINNINDLGPQFISWLSEGIERGDLSINENESLVHTVSGFLFVSLPDTIFKFINSNSLEVDKRKVQSAIEKMNILHSKNDNRFFRARIYEEVEFQGKFKKKSGYMLKSSKILGREGFTGGDGKYIFIDV
ncbi:TraI domain-containing protein [Pantoea agglomerans]|uniref:TraI domain-containing protein n=1 Tax=Enterobacter agglomerans TaxID=549 RepID=UPI001653FDC1|nr:TraI domain-containing protein [Pantoea agglomerans]